MKCITPSGAPPAHIPEEEDAIDQMNNYFDNNIQPIIDELTGLGVDFAHTKLNYEGVPVLCIIFKTQEDYNMYLLGERKNEKVLLQLEVLRPCP